MSVVVTGMEMPTKCCDCDAEQYDEDFFGDEFSHECSFIYKGYTGGIRDRGRLDDCPLRPLPEKHGRLIDAELLRAEFPYPNEEMGGWRNLDEALVHKTGVWASIDCAETIVEAEG